jgi:hypothetical protein
MPSWRPLWSVAGPLFSQRILPFSNLFLVWRVSLLVVEANFVPLVVNPSNLLSSFIKAAENWGPRSEFTLLIRNLRLISLWGQIRRRWNYTPPAVTGLHQNVSRMKACVCLSSRLGEEVEKGSVKQMETSQPTYIPRSVPITASSSSCTLSCASG